MAFEVLASPIQRLPNPSDDAFFEFCTGRKGFRIERTAEGRLVILPGTGGETGSRYASIAGQLWIWTKQNGLGASFDSSTMFRLPNSAMRSPDAAWVSKSKALQALARSEKEVPANHTRIRDRIDFTEGPAATGRRENARMDDKRRSTRFLRSTRARSSPPSFPFSLLGRVAPCLLLSYPDIWFARLQLSLSNRRAAYSPRTAEARMRPHSSCGRSLSIRIS